MIKITSYDDFNQQPPHKNTNTKQKVKQKMKKKKKQIMLKKRVLGKQNNEELSKTEEKL